MGDAWEGGKYDEEWRRLSCRDPKNNQAWLHGERGRLRLNREILCGRTMIKSPVDGRSRLFPSQSKCVKITQLGSRHDRPPTLPWRVADAIAGATG